jgi:hypothetical protein
MNNRILSIAILLFALQSCIAPRSVINSGKVTPKGNFAVGIQYSANVSTAPLNSVKNG